MTLVCRNRDFFGGGSAPSWAGAAASDPGPGLLRSDMVSHSTPSPFAASKKWPGISTEARRSH